MGCGCGRPVVADETSKIYNVYKEAGAEKLRSKGFTVEQLLKFYTAYKKNGHIKMGTTTNEVVRNIIIPETADPPRCYMQSQFMHAIGGAQVAKRLVSHAWKSEFVNTVLNIMLDATEKPKSDFMTGSIVDLVDWYGESRTEPVYTDGLLDAEFALNVVPKTVLDKTYWLCIFAVDEHHAICGDCWTCNKSEAWLAQPVEHLRADPCLRCHEPKFNPCDCGSVKYAPGDARYEIDLFDYVVGNMDALVVSLDPELNSIQRIWVVAEIGKAMQLSTVFFRLCHKLGREAWLQLERGADLMPSVVQCDATSPDDKKRIVDEIQKIDGGIQAYDNFINCMLELSFGVTSRVQRLQGSASRAISNLLNLEMDFDWMEESLLSLPDCLSHFKKLSCLSVNAAGCNKLALVDEFGKGLGQCQALTAATLNFEFCEGLTSIDEVGKGLGQCQALTAATLNFRYCEGLTSIDELGKGLGQCHDLTAATFNFEFCGGLTSIEEFGKGLGQCQALTTATLDFPFCEGLTSIDELGKGLGQCQDLTAAALNFESCKGLTSIDELGKGLGQCQALTARL